MKICLWGDVAAALKGSTKGGGELQTALRAKALAIAGHEVVIIDPYVKESFITDDGVSVISVPDFNKGFRGIRLFWYRIPALWKLFTEQKADFYYITMRNYFHLIPYFAARKTGGKLILAIASDLDLTSAGARFKYSYKPRFDLFGYLTLFVPNDLVFNYLLKKADYILLQHSGQKIRSNHIKGKVGIFPEIIDISTLPEVSVNAGDYFIQVGDVNLLKGVDKLYELIKSCDKKHSFMIVGRAKDRKSKAIFEQLAKMENVIIKGRQNHTDTLQLIANSRALINTSYFEGFPNVFIEAWGSGVPVISLNVNPGNVFDKYKLGICCDGDLEKMKAYVESDASVHIDKDSLVSYVRDIHNFNNAGKRLFNLFNHT